MSDSKVASISSYATELAEMLLNETGVACLSGTAFGEYGEGYLRFSYANSVKNIKEALSRIEKVLAGSGRPEGELNRYTCGWHSQTCLGII